MPFLTPVKTIDYNEAKAYIENHEINEFTIVDVRQPKEYLEGHIPGATLIPLPDLEKNIEDIDLKKPVFVYCAFGSRSRVAAQIMADKGFKKIFDVAGGFNAWQSEIAMGPESLGMELFTGKEEPEEILLVAFSLEQGLRDFYLSLMGKTGNDHVKDLFTKLAEIEIKHQNTIYQQFMEISKKQINRETFEKMVETKAMEGGMTTEEYLSLFNPNLNSPVEVVSLAMSIEAQALDLYHRVGSRLDNEASIKVIQKIKSDEKNHLEMLGKLMDIL